VAADLLDGRDGEVVDQVPRLVRDAFLALMITVASEDVSDEVASRHLVTDVADTRHEFIGHNARLLGIRLQQVLYTIKRHSRSNHFMALRSTVTH